MTDRRQTGRKGRKAGRQTNLRFHTSAHRVFLPAASVIVEEVDLGEPHSGLLLLVVVKDASVDCHSDAPVVHMALVSADEDRLVVIQEPAPAKRRLVS